MVAVVSLAVAFLIAVAMFVSAAVSDRKEAQRQAIIDRQREIRADALRMKALLDQEAFRAARAMTEAAQQARRR